MLITNLSQLKRALKEKHAFEIIEHCIKPEHTGEKRVVQVMQTNGMYSGIYGDPQHPVSNLNYGKGSWFPFGKSGDWTFKDGLCIRKGVWTIRVLDEIA